METGRREGKYVRTYGRRGLAKRARRVGSNESSLAQRKGRREERGERGLAKRASSRLYARTYARTYVCVYVS